MTLADTIENTTTVRWIMKRYQVTRERAEMIVKLAARNIRADETGTLTKTRALSDASRYEYDADGDPQIFPYDEASIAVVRAAAALNPNDHSERAEYLREVAGSVRDHRNSFRAGHTASCRADLYRGLCH